MLISANNPLIPKQTSGLNYSSSNFAPSKGTEQSIETIFHLIIAEMENPEISAKENAQLSNIVKERPNLVDLIHTVGQQLAAEEPFSVLKLENLRRNIHVLTGTPLPEIEEAINRCQEEILQKMTLKDKSELAKQVTNQDLLTEFRRRTFKHFYTQIKKEKPEYWHSTKEILTYLMKRTQEMMIPSDSNKEILGKIYHRAKNSLDLLNKGERVKTPSFYHGTKTTSALVDILKSAIWSQEAAYGKGAYLSSRMEEEYGPYFISFDLLDLASEKLAPDNQANRSRIQTATNSIWRAFRENVSTQDNRVVFVVAPSKEAADTLREVLVKENLGHIEVRTYQEVELERNLIEELRGLIEPKEWRSEWGDKNLFSALLDIKVPKIPPMNIEEPDNATDWE